MRHDKLERELKLMLLLTENHNYTVSDICDKMNISRRNLYYYLDFFKDAGFIVEHHRPYYSISKNSALYKKIDAAVHFTEDEAIVLKKALEATGDSSEQALHLIQKLEKLYDMNIVENVEMREQIGRNRAAIYEAIKQHRVVMLEGYSSPHSNSVSNRLVEPFLFMNSNQEVRCFELASKKNKTFKLSRISNVVLQDLLWSHENQHREMLTDIFMFSSEQQTIVKLRMGRLATYVLREEYPKAEKYIEQDDDCHWIAEIPVSSFLGIGRFVLGLMEDIEVLGNDEFRNYLRDKIEKMKQKVL